MQYTVVPLVFKYEQKNNNRRHSSQNSSSVVDSKHLNQTEATTLHKLCTMLCTYCTCAVKPSSQQLSILHNGLLLLIAIKYMRVHLSFSAAGYLFHNQQAILVGESSRTQRNKMCQHDLYLSSLSTHTHTHTILITTMQVSFLKN